jgi:spore maturation protein CgeB
MRLFVFGSSLTSSYWNGAATYYRGIYKNLHRLGHEVTFAEPDIYGRQQHRDLQVVDYARVIVYQSPGDIPELLSQTTDSDQAQWYWC